MPSRRARIPSRTASSKSKATNFITACIQSGVFKPKDLTEGFEKIKEYMKEIFDLMYNVDGKPRPSRSEDQTRICERCARHGKDVKISQGVAEFSVKTYGEQLCFDCQKEVRKK